MGPPLPRRDGASLGPLPDVSTAAAPPPPLVTAVAASAPDLATAPLPFVPRAGALAEALAGRLPAFLVFDTE